MTTRTQGPIRARLILLLLPLAPGTGTAAVRLEKQGLDREVAQARAARVSGVRYKLQLRLGGTEEDFSGSVDIAFELKVPGEPLTIDFKKGSIDAVNVNGSPLEKVQYNGLFLTLPSDALLAGPNRVQIAFRHAYSNTGAGLYRFLDPADGRIYLYSDLEPYDANRIFPCFDQPDLKARYTLKVEAPAEWEVISSVLESSIGQADGNRRIWSFPQSPPFSTYIFSLHAGPYTLWKSSYENTQLRLFARVSLAQYVDVAEWFDITRRGLAFFNAYFDYPYPFGKYDQIIVPDFNSGAMENVAAVTFSEGYVHRGGATWKQRENRANVILHEMAHMWFGNLVTMDWWDDLWLNESFASYMAALALYEATEFRDAWEVFFTGYKGWAYWEDQLVTTHPIEADASDTEQAFANFDGITYGKGASVLKQVSFFIGPDNFRDGVREYFNLHDYRNAERKDFIQALERAGGKDLSAWTDEWLKTAGLNSLRADYSCRDGKIEGFRLLQSAPKDLPTLRTHRTQIGLFYESTSQTLAAGYAGAVTSVPEIDGVPCPDFIYPNRGDNDYVKVRLDARSLLSVKKRLSGIEDDLDRAMLWMSLWSMVYDAELDIFEYMDIVFTHLPAEKSFQTAAKILETLHGRRMNSTSVLKYLSAGQEPLSDERRALVSRLEGFLWERFSAAKEEDWRKLYYDAYVRVAESPAALARLGDILEGRSDLGFELDQDRRWGIIHQTSRHNAPRAAELREAETKRDSSRRGQTAAIASGVARPDWTLKEEWIKRITDESSTTALAELKAAMKSLFPYEQTALHKRFAEDYFTQLGRLAKTKTPEFLESFAEDLVPADCLAQDSARIATAIELHADLPPVAMKGLRIARQENDRCVAVRDLARNSIRAR